MSTVNVHLLFRPSFTSDILIIGPISHLSLAFSSHTQPSADCHSNIT